MVAMLFLMADALGGPDKPASATTDRVGRVVLVGNGWTSDRAILRQVPVFPGEPLPGEAELLRAEIRLLVQYHRRFDLDAGKRPTVEVLPAIDGSAYRDIRVSFPERKK